MIKKCLFHLLQWLFLGNMNYNLYYSSRNQGVMGLHAGFEYNLIAGVWTSYCPYCRDNKLCRSAVAFDLRFKHQCSPAVK